MKITKTGILAAAMTFTLAGCGGGGGGGGGVLSSLFGGWSVDGPALDMPVQTYRVDLAAVGGQGTSLNSGRSNATTGAISISITQGEVPAIVVGTPDGDTVDLSTCTDVTDKTTCSPPYYAGMQSAITSAMETANASSAISLQMNPMTTLAVMIALQNANAGAADPDQEFEDQLANAADLVMSTFGAGMTAAEYDLFTSATVIEPGMDTNAQTKVVTYRGQLLQLNAMVKVLVDASGTATPDEVLAQLAADLVDDGILNASTGSAYDITAITSALGADPATTEVPDTATNQKPADVVAILQSEAAVTAPEVDTSGLTPATPQQAQSKVDTDGDGVSNNRDPFPDNAPPVATADAYTLNEGATLSTSSYTKTPAIDGVLVNDTDDNNFKTAILVTGVQHGTLDLLPSGEFTYTHDGSETTSDSFTYKINDGVQDGNTVTVTLTIQPVNDAPVATADSYSVDEHALLTVAAAGVLGNDTDAEGSALTAVLDTDVANGNLTLNADGSFSYQHDGSETTSDSFTYHAVDADSAVSTTVTVDITVNPVNDAPVAQADTYATTEGQSLVVNAASGVLANDSDVDSVGLTVAVASGPAHGTLTLNGDGSFTYNHSGENSPTDSFTYTVSDGSATANGTVTINVTQIDDAPVAVGDSYSVDEGGTLTTSAATGVQANDTDDEDAPGSLTVLLDGDVSNGTLTLNTDGSFTYVHDGGETNSDSFSYHVVDSNSTATGSVSVSIAVNPVDDTPVAQDDSYGVTEGQSLVVNTASGVLANDSDVDSASLTASVDSGAAHGSLTLNADGSFTYDHDGDNGTSDSFTYTVSDGNTSATATVTITVTQVNDAPRAVDDFYSLGATDATINIDAASGVLANDSDDEGETMTVTLVTSPTHGTLTLNADGSFDYTGDGSAFTEDLFQYQVHTATGDGGMATVTIAPNLPPATVADSYSVDEGATLTVAVAQGVEANDPTDADGDATTVALVSDVQHGTLTLNADGSFSYVHDGGESTSDSFTYHRNDGQQFGPTATVSITVNPINDKPVAVAGDGPYQVNEGDTLTVAVGDGVSANDSDAENDSLTAQVVTDVQHGSLTLNADGSFVYTHDGTETTSDSFTYRQFDGIDHSDDTVTVSITVNPVNDLPVLVNDSAATKINTQVSIDVLANDSDAEDGVGSNLTLVSVQSTANGGGMSEQGQTVSISAGQVIYTPAGDFSGSDSFTYTVQDAGGAQVTATVSVTVTAFPVDVSGVWKTTATVTNVTDATECGLTVNQQLPFYVGINQQANALSVYTHMGDAMTGNMTDQDTTVYPFSVSSTEMSISGNYDDVAGTLSGSVSVDQTGCVVEASLGASQQLRGRPNDVTKLGGLFGIELLDQGTGMRSVNLAQIEVPASGDPSVFLPGGELTITAYDAVAGFFEGDLSYGAYNSDITGEGVSDSLYRFHRVSGLLVTESDVDSCAYGSCSVPAIVIDEERTLSRALNGGTLDQEKVEYEGYGRRLQPAASNSVVARESGSALDTFSLNNPPLDLGDSAAPLGQVMQATDAGDNPLCQVNYRNNLRMLQMLPRPTFSFDAPAFQRNYATVSCSAASGSVADAAAFKVNVTDNATTETFNGTAVVGTVPASTAVRTDFTVNGAAPSQTMVGGVIPLFGFFDLNDALDVSQMVPGLGNGEAMRLTIRQSDYWNSSLGYVDEWRVSADTAGTADFTVPANTLGDQPVILRMQGVYNTNSGTQVANTDWLLLPHGFGGAMQVEFDSGSGFIAAGEELDYSKLQVQVLTDWLGLGQAMICKAVADNPSSPVVSCDGTKTPVAQVDFAGDTLTVNMKERDNNWVFDTSDGKYMLVFDFSDAASANVDMNEGTQTSISGPGLVVNPELSAVSRYYTNGDKAVGLSLLNPFYQLFASGKLYDAADNEVTVLWDDSDGVGGNDGVDVYGSHYTMPLDGVAPQTTGGYMSQTNRVIGSDERVNAGDYQLRLVPANNMPLPGGWTFENYYAKADAVDLDPPTRDEITLNATVVSTLPNEANTIADAADVGANAMALSWTSSAPADTGWQVTLTIWDTGDGSEEGSNPETDPADVQLRTKVLTSADSELSYNAGTQTWTWENNDLNAVFGGAVQFKDGLYAKVQLRAMEGDLDSVQRTKTAFSETFWIKHSTAPNGVTATLRYVGTTPILGVDAGIVGAPDSLENVQCIVADSLATYFFLNRNDITYVADIGATGTDVGIAWSEKEGKPSAALAGPLELMTCTADLPLGAKTPTAADFTLQLEQILDENETDITASMSLSDLDLVVTPVNN